MSFHSSANNTFPPFSEKNNNATNVNLASHSISNPSEENIRNNYENSHYMHTPNSNVYSLPTSPFPGAVNNINGTSQFYNDAPPPRSLNNAAFPGPLNVPFPRPLNNVPFPRPLNNAPQFTHSEFTNTRPHVSGFPSQPFTADPPFNSGHGQSSNRNVTPSNIDHSNANFNFDPRNISLQRPPPPVSNMTRFQNNEQFNSIGNVPISSPRFPTPVNFSTINNFHPHANYSAGNMNNFSPQAIINTNPLTLRPPIINSAQDSSLMLHNPSIVQLPFQMLQNTTRSENLNRHLNPLLHGIEVKIDEYISKFSIKKEEKKPEITIPEFRYVVKAALRMITLLNERKSKLSKLLDASESEWELEVENSLKEKEELSALCSIVSDSDYLNNIAEKLRLIKKKRERKKITKQNRLSEKMRAEQKKKERDQEIDKWLDSIKEKNEKIKREAELKKEADFILLEVRRKIHEAKKTIEKIKVFEKLRIARQANASQKGLHVLSIHNAKFEKKMSVLKEIMLKQLADYEAEEKALKVMLETEQEGQREEKVQWKIQKIKSLQQNKQNHIMESLFGISDDPLPTDPMYLFHKYQTSATSSIENLVQIRQQWDVHMAKDGESIPQQWIVPVAPSNSSWEQFLLTTKR